MLARSTFFNKQYLSLINIHRAFFKIGALRHNRRLIKKSWIWNVGQLLLILKPIQFSSVQFSRSVVSDSLRPHESQHPRPPCPSPTPGVHPDSRPLTQWWHPAISSSVVSVSSCLQSLLASESFPMNQLFPWGGQSTGVSALVSISPSKEHPGLISFRMDWLDLLAVQGTLKSLPQNSTRIIANLNQPVMGWIVSPFKIHILKS